MNIARLGLEPRTRLDLLGVAYMREPEGVRDLLPGGLASRSQNLLLPPRDTTDEQIIANSARLLGGEKSTHQHALLDAIELYLERFGVNEKSKQNLQALEYRGPRDTLRRLPEDDKFYCFDDQYPKYLKLKRELFLDPERSTTVFHNSGKHNDFWKEFFKWSIAKRPDLFTQLSGNEFRNDITGEVWDLNKHDPLLASALCLQEDLLVLQKNSRSPVTDDASVCFPSRWNPKDAIDNTVRYTHIKVPKFLESGLEHPIQTIMNRLNVPMTRFTRLVHPLPYLHQVTDQDLITLPLEKVQYTPENVGDKLFLRLEKQIFSRGDNVTGGNPAFEDLLAFSFKTYIFPLKGLEASPRFAKVILNLHKGFKEEKVDQNKPHDIFREYRGGTTAFLDPVIEYLEQIAGDKDLERNEALKILSRLQIPNAAYERCPLASANN